MYLKCEVLWLADVFEKNGKSSLKIIRLSPRNYLSAPFLSCNAMLNMAKVGLDLISDAGMCLIFEKALRGGGLYFPNDLVKSIITIYNFMTQNNKRNILCIEMRVISMAMKCLNFLQQGRFKWTDHKEFDSNRYSNKSSKGCVLEVDIELSKYLNLNLNLILNLSFNT